MDINQFAAAIAREVLYRNDAKKVLGTVASYASSGIGRSRVAGGARRYKFSYKAYGSKEEASIDVIVWQLSDGSLRSQFASIGEQGHENIVWKVLQKADGSFAFEEISKKVLRLEESFGFEPPL